MNEIKFVIYYVSMNDVSNGLNVSIDQEVPGIITKENEDDSVNISLFVSGMPTVNNVTMGIEKGQYSPVGEDSETESS